MDWVKRGLTTIRMLCYLAFAIVMIVITGLWLIAMLFWDVEYFTEYYKYDTQ